MSQQAGEKCDFPLRDTRMCRRFNVSEKRKTRANRRQNQGSPLSVLARSANIFQWSILEPNWIIENARNRKIAFFTMPQSGKVRSQVFWVGAFPHFDRSGKFSGPRVFRTG
uniref:Uncharacterized protein n=1 Tax=Candidatus Kentrum sp. SD TaxID=2126332 RepID=A0A450Y5T0_9GAMM|nr:MAG: hypothetical protein BECKSD772F_GA0070984_10073 [Candidatus Kentron sp. SD]VFK78359.1 MAG: hypothetical protein BECKSD772D_GA0070982_10133 [Candidatus Kentron sp. SD]